MQSATRSQMLRVVEQLVEPAAKEVPVCLGGELLSASCLVLVPFDGLGIEKTDPSEG